MFIVMAIFILFLDQISKMIIISNMYLGQSKPVIGNIFNITYIHNPGAAFGIMPDKTWIFISVSFLVALGTIIYYYCQKAKTTGLTWSFALILGGTLGNLVDRIRIGQVVDFIDFRIWPVFNLADVAIVSGAAILFILVWKMEGLSGGEG